MAYVWIVYGYLIVKIIRYGCIYSYCEELEEKKGKKSLMVANSFYVSENLLALSKRYLWKGKVSLSLSIGERDNRFLDA